MDVAKHDGPRGGAYYLVNLSDGRQLVVSRKRGDPRVWLGRPEEKASWQGQRGGIGKIDKLLDEWFAEIASNPEARELHLALSALRDARARAQ